MGKLTPFADLAKTAFRLGIQPALFVAKREARYRAAGLASVDELPVCCIAVHADSPTCWAGCGQTLHLSRAHLAEYRSRDRRWRCRPWLGTACVIALTDFASYAAYANSVERRTGDAIRRSCNKARRHGYVAGLFHPPYFRAGMAGILGSKRFRSGGLVPYGLIGGASYPPDHGHVEGYRPQEPCRLHWTLHWGVFATGGEGGQPAAVADWQLAGFIKLRRIGSLVHALQIMGHGAHMAAGINDLMHMELVRWLIDNPDGHCGGITHYMYGALDRKSTRLNSSHPK